MGALVKRRLSILICLSIIIALIPCRAGAEKSGSYVKKQDGTGGVEIGIASDSLVVLENEDISFSFEKNGSDELVCVADSVYTITNSDSKRAYAALAVVRLLKVEEVGVPGSDEDIFVSGEKLSVGDKEMNGFIYPVETKEKIVKKSAYDTFSDALYHMEFSGYFDEAFARYGVAGTADHEKKLDEAGGVPKRVEKQMWRVSENGEEKLCVVVYNLSFEPGESKEIRNTQRILASMERPTDISEKGTIFTIKYTGNNLESFYNVRNVRAVLDFKDSALGDEFESKAPFYSDDGKPTLRFSNGDFGFSLSFGKDLSKDEIYDIYAGEGYVKKILDVAAVAVSFIVVISAAFIVYSVRKRKKSGIGLSL